MNQIPTPIPTKQYPDRPTVAPRRPSPSPHRQSAVPLWLTAMLIVTVVLLAISLVLLTVALATTDFTPDSPSNNPPSTGGEGESQSEKPSATPQDKPSVGKYITLPSVTASGSYSYSLAGAADISSDSRIQSTNAVLIDVTNGQAVATKKGGEKVYPASMTKVMTLLVACENATDPTALLTVTEEMVAKYKASYTPPEKGPSLATEKWAAGVQVSLEDALFLAIYESDTYACWLLAESVAGSEEAFVRMMNDRARSLGLTGTHFANCTGLFSQDHYTTCGDMAAIMAAAMNNQAARTVLTRYTAYTVNLYVDGVWNDAFSMFSGWYSGRLETYRYGSAAAYYAGNGSDIRLIAGKTGYETIPKYCFVTAAQNDETGTLFVCVQVGASSAKESTDDSREIYQKYAGY